MADGRRYRMVRPGSADKQARADVDAATAEVAEYVLGISASQIIYLVDVEGANDGVPF